MANLCSRSRQALQSSTTRNAISNFFTLKSSSLASSSKFPCLPTSPKPNSSPLHRLFSFSRLPLELGCAQSLMPLHNATACALFTSLLSLHAQSWGCLSEGFATPL